MPGTFERLDDAAAFQSGDFLFETSGSGGDDVFWRGVGDRKGEVGRSDDRASRARDR